MKNQYFKDKTLLIEPGNKYDLKIIKLINVADDQEFYVGRDKNGLKHLIPVKYYIQYGIRAGDSIKCHLDKINCLGRFFFEPEHPVYKRCESYHFKLIEFNNFHHDEKFFTARVRDVFGKEHDTKKFKMKNECPALKISSVLCLVTSIKKARLSLKVIDSGIIKIG
ncbi:MAG: hypothetical protein ACOCWM_02935 [Cyclobacteriaceae bacterium]